MREFDLLYCTRMCTEETYKDLFANSFYKPAQQSQKYHRTLFQGFCENEDVNVVAFSSLPLNKMNYKGKYYKGGQDKYNKRVYYISEWNIPILSYLSQYYNGKRIVKRRFNKDQTIIVIDVLNVSYNMGIVRECRKYRIPIIGIVTDLPDILFSTMGNYIRKKSENIINSCDGYVLLTEAMNDIVNPGGSKPYVVIEGQVDDAMMNIPNEQDKKDDPPVILYSGSLHKIHGIDYLIKGFLQSGIEGVELHIYGEGDYVDELRAICREYDKVKYFGVKLIGEVVLAQIKATLLVNPRPSNQEFVKYSFPSKNMEYMASGTPLLTTKLPGMPAEYELYVYLIGKETAEGISEELKYIFDKTKDELHFKGMKAKNFVMQHKTGKRQTKKILELAELIMERK